MLPPRGFHIDSDYIEIALAAHDDVEVHWVASFCGTRDASGAWTGSCEIQGANRLLEVARLRIPEESSEEIQISAPRPEQVLQVDPMTTLHLEPDTPGEWATGAPAAAERQARDRARDALFAHPLVAPGATDASETYSAILVADRVLVTVPHRVPGLTLSRLEYSTVGLDAGQVIADLMPQLGYPGEFNEQVWLQMVRDQNPSAFIHAPRIHAESAAQAIQLVSRLSERLLDVTAIRRTSRARLLGGLLIGSPVNGVRTYTPWRGTPAYGGNLATGFAAGEDVRHLLQVWSDLEGSDRAQLWLSVYSDSFAEARPDHQFLRRFSLLEGIAGGVFPSQQPVLDPSGAPYLMSGGRQYTTDQARGAVYSLLLQVAGGALYPGQFLAQRPSSSSKTSPEVALWEDVGAWVKIRNTVAHEGTAQRTSVSPISAARQSFEASLAQYGAAGGTWSTGFAALASALRSAAESTIYAVIAGRV